MVTIGTLSWKVQVEEAADAKEKAKEVSENVEEAKEAMEGADESSESLRDKFEGLSAVQETVGKGFDKMNAKAGFLGTALSFVSGIVMTVLGSLLSLKALVVGGLIAAIVALAVAWKENIGDIQGRVAGFKEFLIEQFGALKTGALKIWSNFVEGFAASNGDVRDLKVVFTAVLDGIERGLKGFWKFFQPLWNGFVGVLMKAAKVAGSVFGGIISWLAKMEKQFGMVSGAIEIIVKLVAVFATAWAIVQVVTAIIGVVIGFISALGTVLSVVASVISVIGTLISVFTTVVSVVATVIAALNPITLIILAIIGVIAALYAAWETNFLGIRDITDDVISKATELIEGFINFVKGVPNMIVEFFTGIGASMAEAFQNAYNSLIPSNIKIPAVTIGGGSIAGQEIPSTTIGGGTLDIPQLRSGGMIEQGGMAELHAGEAVIPADVTRQLGLGKGGGGEELNKTEIDIGGIEIGDQSLDLSRMNRHDMQKLAQLIAKQLGDKVHKQ